MSKKHYQNNKTNEEIKVSEEAVPAAEEVKAEPAEPAEPAAAVSETPKADSVSDEMGIIASGTRITGDIMTKGHLTIAGQVDGDIDARGDIFTTGQIQGKIRCRKLKADAGTLKTEMNAAESVIIGKSSKVVGSICCRDITVEGTVEGDIQASGRVILTSCAAVKGNITASNYRVEEGAKLDGTVSIA